MILMKHNLLLLLLALAFSFNNAIECRTCIKTDISCLFPSITNTEKCENEDDHCYTWFSRSGSSIEVQRGCISITSPAYRLINTMIEEHDNGCVKRIYGLDCFVFCSIDACN